MSDIEDELRMSLASRADRVHSDLSGPAIRALGDRRRVTRRYAPVAAAVAVLAVVGLLFLRPAPQRAQPATPIGITQSQSVAATPDVTSRPLTTTTRPLATTTPPSLSRPSAITMPPSTR
jgi:hypothetical protein